VPAVDVPSAMAYLWDREMQSRVYRLEEIEVELPEGPANALAFTVDRAHPDYAGALSLPAMARLIREAEGRRGSARDYLARTMAELERLGVVDPLLRRLDRMVRSLGHSPRCAA
jgi:glutathione-specific gamma-glutamylcyclotransferase